MIDPKHLRIGNWLHHKTSGRNFQATYHEIRYAVLHPEDDPYMPIPLNPEILEKCGFVKSVIRIGNGSLGLDYEDYRMGNFALKVLPTGVEVEGAPSWATIEDRSYYTTVNYLHQLQNLYFALTGSELGISL